MKYFTILVLFICIKLNSQISVFQNFEGTGTWGFTGGTINTETFRTGSSSARLGRVVGSCAGTLDANEMIFDPVYLIGSSCPGIFRFYHSVRTSSGSGCGAGRGMDSYEGFAVYVKLNGAASWTLLYAFSGFGDLSWGWSTNAVNTSNQCANTPFPNPYVYNVPGGSSSAQFKITTIKGTGSVCGNFGIQAVSATGSNYDRGDEGLFIDDVSFTTTAPCVLPIQLIDFYATKSKSQNDITWKVAQEENILYYILEKSEDGTNFTELITVSANNESQIKTYSVIDDGPFNEITYYRLKTRENNGSIVTHKIISIDENSKDWSYTHYQQANNLVLEFKNTIPKNTSAEIFDLSGKQLLSSSIDKTQTLINTENLSNGIYFVRLSTAYKTEYFKIIISN
jgi:hypothetical protein